MILINPGMVLPLYRRQFFGRNAEADFLKNCRVGAQLSLEVLLSDQSYAEFLCDVRGFDFCFNICILRLAHVKTAYCHTRLLIFG